MVVVIITATTINIMLATNAEVYLTHPSLKFSLVFKCLKPFYLSVKIWKQSRCLLTGNG